VNSPPLLVRDLGRRSYADAYDIQSRTLDEVLAWRAALDTPSHDGAPAADLAPTDATAAPHNDLAPEPPLGVLLLVEHDPVVTVSRRTGARDHLLASPELLALRGVSIAETDRGGDITYHGPGQLVAYPILDLNRLNLGLHDYMRLLESVVIDTLAEFNIIGLRDPAATGVWVGSRTVDAPLAPVSTPDAQADSNSPLAKIAAMGVRVRRWISMHGLALNVSTNLDHFSLIVPCGLVGRPVTSLRRELGDRAPDMPRVADVLVRRFTVRIEERRRAILSRAATHS
jgi:lipoyl(octanoyl) transferase